MLRERPLIENAIPSTLFFNKLKNAIQFNKIRPQYQPVVKLANGVISSFEVLARWTDDSLGVVSPGQFIPVAESSKLIRSLTESIIDQVLVDMPSIKSKFNHIKLAVNISPNLFKSNVLLDIFNARIKQHSHLFSSLDLEIVESEMLDREEETTAQIQLLNQMGLNITIDDYGKNYSSLSRLVELPFNRLKIDQAFVKDLGIKRESTIVVRNILALAADLNISVIAEGIENARQRDALLELGCEYGQGWFYERDVSVGQIHALPMAYDI